jgi:pyruvate/2-oxoglutarate dehydrogenase complex dihydrolipoamide dehydrogenase (E3) component
VKHAAEFGMVTGSAVIDMVRVRERKRHMVDVLIAMHLERYTRSACSTDPPLARVGLSEAEAHRRGIGVRVAKLPMSAVLRTWTISESGGFMKALVDSHGDRILGFTMLGPEAGEVMAAVQTAMLAGLPYTGLRDAILTHPTMAEGLTTLFASIPPPR